jgi:hypothetical protein
VNVIRGNKFERLLINYSERSINRLIKKKNLTPKGVLELRVVLVPTWVIFEI